MMADMYAVIEESTGRVANVVLWDGEREYSLEQGLILFKSESAVIGGTFKDGLFTPPGTLPAPVPSSEQVLANNTQIRSTLQAAASQAMTPLLVSLQLGDATVEETTSARAWQSYVRDLKAIDLTELDPTWPKIPA